ncbi:MAG: exo-alpha-sialidase [Prevotella sp.]|nr:exo-alpha-sialidase [Prevotella sp.]
MTLLSFFWVGEVFSQSLSTTPLEELIGKTISVAQTPANSLTTGQWYVMFDRGYTGSNPHGYLYENMSSHTLYNTATVPSGLATAAARFLVRLSDAGDGKYYIQTGFGNYFGVISESAAVPVTAGKNEALIVEKIANTDGHFYLQSTTTNVILDANDLRGGDATVVGWGTSKPTTTGGNNDWAFYPVTLEDIDSSIAIFESDVQVTRGYQTCGRGNQNTLLLRVDMEVLQNISDASFTVSLNDAAQANISSLYVYKTTATEFLANIPASPLGTTNAIGSTATVNIGSVAAGSHHFWICATISDDAELEAMLTTAVKNFDYTCNGGSQSLDMTAIGNPSRQGVKVFAQQNFVFKPTTDNCRFYRIPAMVLDKDGNIVVSIDKRYNSNADLGNNHKIDVITLRSEDGGKTWKDKADVAIGDGSSSTACGFGDPALAMAPNGDLICLMASGNTTWGYGMKSCGFAKSTDNGKTWKLKKNLFTTTSFYDEYSSDGKFSMTNYFTTSGKGLTTNDGVIMFATNCRKQGDGTNLVCIIYSTDNGETWRLSKTTAYTGGDESKLEQLNDGSLLLSVRQSGDRGWNTGTYTKNSDCTVTFNWGSQYRKGDIWGNACNADLVYYSRESNGEPDIMLHAYISSSGRESLQLSMSIDGGKSWNNVYNIQPNGSCYSTMIVLPDGTLAILYEDESYSAGNGYAINYVTITKEQILKWYDELDERLSTAEVKFVEHGITTDGGAPWCTWLQTTTGNWAKQFESNGRSGFSGVVVSADYYAFNRQNGYDQRVLCFKPSAAGASDVFTIEAPEGYLIENYSIGGYFNTVSETYTLTAENGESVRINKNKSQQNPPDFLTTNVGAKSTKLTLSNGNSSNNSYALISHFVLNLKRDNGSTGISGQPFHAAEPNGQVYTVQGIPLAKVPSQKGIYLQNGRKFVVK